MSAASELATSDHPMASAGFSGSLRTPEYSRLLPDSTPPMAESSRFPATHRMPVQLRSCPYCMKKLLAALIVLAGLGAGRPAGRPGGRARSRISAAHPPG